MVTEPTSMEELAYFTNRVIDGKPVRVWVYRRPCDKCGKALMGKPVEKGKVRVRAAEYVCPECGHAVEKQAYEDTLDAEYQYICPSCGKEGEGATPFKRKSIKGVSTLRLACDHCSASIDVTKKMKKPKVTK